MGVCGAYYFFRKNDRVKQKHTEGLRPRPDGCGNWTEVCPGCEAADQQCKPCPADRYFFESCSSTSPPSPPTPAMPTGEPTSAPCPPAPTPDYDVAYYCTGPTECSARNLDSK